MNFVVYGLWSKPGWGAKARTEESTVGLQESADLQPAVPWMIPPIQHPTGARRPADLHARRRTLRRRTYEGLRSNAREIQRAQLTLVVPDTLLSSTTKPPVPPPYPPPPIFLVGRRS